MGTTAVHKCAYKQDKRREMSRIIAFLACQQWHVGWWWLQPSWSLYNNNDISLFIFWYIFQLLVEMECGTSDQQCSAFLLPQLIKCTFHCLERCLKEEAVTISRLTESTLAIQEWEDQLTTEQRWSKATRTHRSCNDTSPFSLDFMAATSLYMQHCEQ